MNTVRPAAGGGRIVEISPLRLNGWFARFIDRHSAGRYNGESVTEVRGDTVTVRAGDGATASVTTRFPPLGLPEATTAGLARTLDGLVEHLMVPRRIGLVLVRLGGHSVGVAESGRLLVSATDRTLVHGRHKVGGWSQQRFARRRAEQARDALRSAADDAVRVLVPRLPELVAVQLGGDRMALRRLAADQRLAEVLDIALPQVLDVPRPSHAVLAAAAQRALAVEILVTQP